MKAREIKKEDIKVGAVIIDEGGKSWEIKSIQGNYIHFTERTYYSTMDRVLSRFTIAEEEPKTNDTKVMTFVGGFNIGVRHGKNYNVKDTGADVYELIGDDGNKRVYLKKFFADPSEYRHDNNIFNFFDTYRYAMLGKHREFIRSVENCHCVTKSLNEKVGTKHDRIGGNHYNINDPIQFAKDNFSKEELKGFYRINIIKYVARYDKKNGVEDLEKASHYLDMLKELEDAKQAK